MNKHNTRLFPPRLHHGVLIGKARTFARTIAALLLALLGLTTSAHAQEASDDGPRFGVFVGGLRAPDVTAFVGGATLTLATKPRGWEPRLYLTAYRTEDNHTKTTGGLAVAQDTYWFGVYGLGFGGGAGYAMFDPKNRGGWDGGSTQLVSYFVPVMLRLGSARHFELGLKVGATLFLERDLRPFGYVHFGVLF